MRNWTTWTLLFALACSGDDGKGDTDETDTTPPTNTTDQGGCRDPEVNPWAGTCVETYLAGCFDPTGSCTGERQGVMGLIMTWENGATVEQSGLTTTLTASNGTVCATAVTSVTPVGDCFSTTTYTDDGGDEMQYCIHADGSMGITCADGSSFEITAEEAQSPSGQSCQYGGGEECVFE